MSQSGSFSTGGGGSSITFNTQAGTATPTAGVINIYGAGTATTSGAGNTVTITTTGGSSFTWTIVTVNTAMASNNGYIANAGSLLMLTLPTVSAVGDMIRVTGININLGWQVAQNAGQTIFYGNQTTTTGTGGYLASTLTYDCAELLCIAANTNWMVLSSIGNLTVN